MQFSINKHAYNFKILPIAYRKLLLNLFKNNSYFEELLVDQTIQIMWF
jgi:hypothetical protein